MELTSYYFFPVMAEHHVDYSIFSIESKKNVRNAYMWGLKV